MIKLKSSAATHVGLRRTANEDRYFADDARGLYVVCDGMGGHRSGEEAAQQAIVAFTSAITTGKTPSEAASDADAAVLAIEGVKGFSNYSPGCTLTALIISKDGAQITHVGDSEAFRLSADGYFQKVTKDHGGMFGLDNFVGLGNAYNGFFSDVIGREANAGDRFLLASDGLSKHLKFEEIQRAMGEQAIDGMAERLIEICNERGGKDNITVIVVDVLEG